VPVEAVGELDREANREVIGTVEIQSAIGASSLADVTTKPEFGCSGPPPPSTAIGKKEHHHCKRKILKSAPIAFSQARR